MKKCVCGHEMTKHDYEGKWVCHRCGRTKLYPSEIAREDFERTIRASDIYDALVNKAGWDKDYAETFVFDLPDVEL